MTTFTITGDDTFIVYDQVITDLANDDVSTVTFGANIFESKVGKNGNTIHAFNEQGNTADVIIRVIKGSTDDRFLQGKIDGFIKDKVGSALAFGSFVKRLGDGSGNIVSESATLLGGVIKKQPGTKGNTSGDTEQAVSVYEFFFPSVKRGIQ